MFEFVIAIKDHKKVQYWVSKKVYKSFLVCRNELEQMATNYISTLSGNQRYKFYNSKSKSYGKVPNGNFIATISMDKVTVMHKYAGILSTTITKLRTYTIMKRVAPKILYVTEESKLFPEVIEQVKKINEEVLSKVKKIEQSQEEVHSESNQQ
jgi:hypothetical protein